MPQRKIPIAGLCSLMAAGFFFFSTGQAQAASGNGPYYAEPSWSQKLPAATRFVVLTDWNSEAVLDRETGLVWERSLSLTPFKWNSVDDLCILRIIGGRIGWRAPSVHELASLVDPSIPVRDSGPRLPLGHPFTNVEAARYWSATPVTRLLTNDIAYYVDFRFGQANSDSKTNEYRVWCVRGGSNADHP